DGRWYLYDTRNDPGGNHQLEQERPDKLRELVAIYERYAEGNGIVSIADNWNPWHGFGDESESN
ncbi:MAG: hypothetical protein ACR2NZ_11155, partial [Rubripirellula sp.]